ncbi:YhgE/Pip domain-containing protein [Enterococcus sp. C76]|uniref:YhgE/Pip domain-containing protein n=1 Tax=Enterococcus sp. C76 TaxID=3231334 RepID=UPI0019FF4E33|nr:ABC transporter permease [Enterococcus faecium]EME3555083.1 YhgE/Pip family protein [Enterococcus faecium]
MKKKVVFTLLFIFLAILPALYSGLFLGAIRDPYGKTDQIPVALVANYKDQRSSIYQSIKDTKIFDFKQEDLATAKQELKTGKVYGILSFEPNFSDDLEKFIMTNKPAHIRLYTSSSLNFSAQKILTTATTEIVEKVNQKLATNALAKASAATLPIPSKITNMVVLKTHDITPVKNNAEGLAPYFFALTLFVGGIFINQIFTRLFASKKGKFKSFYLWQFSGPAFMSICQAAIVTLLTTLIFHFTTVSWVGLFGFLILLAWTFDSLIIALNRLFPNFGVLIVLVLLMLQTSMAGGSYPLILSDPIFQNASQFLPMTYGVLGLRKFFNLGLSGIWGQIWPLLVFLAVGQILIALAYFWHERHSKYRTQ